MMRILYCTSCCAILNFFILENSGSFTVLRWQGIIDTGSISFVSLDSIFSQYISQLDYKPKWTAILPLLQSM